MDSMSYYVKCRVGIYEVLVIITICHMLVEALQTLSLTIPINRL